MSESNLTPDDIKAAIESAFPEYRTLAELSDGNARIGFQIRSADGTKLHHTASGLLVRLYRSEFELNKLLATIKEKLAKASGGNKG